MTALPAAAPASVERVELCHVTVPMRQPFEAAHGTETVREAVIVRVIGRDGVEGCGECDALSHPTYTHEYARGAFAVLRDELVPAWFEGADGADGVGRVGRFHPMASAALRSATIDLALRREGRNLAAALGATRSTLERTVVLGRGEPSQLASAIEAAVAGGAAAVKLKISGRRDLAVLAELRQAFPTVDLCADANGSLGEWAPLGHGGSIASADRERLDELELRYLEQPFPAEDLLASAALRRACRTPIVLDESVTSLATARLAHAVGALDGINVKPARLGGIAAAAEVARFAAGEGLGAFCGGMLELGVGRATAAAVAALDACRWPTDLGPSQAYVADGDELTEPITLDAAGRLVVPTGAGIGVEVRLEQLERRRIDRVVLDHRSAARR